MIFGSRFSDEFQMEYGPVPGGVTIISCNSDADEIAVPAEIDGQSVVKIEPRAFSFKNVKYISFPPTLRQIDHHAFAECRQLQRIEFPPKLESIGNYAFYNCYGLRMIHLTPYIKSIGFGAFKNCENLEEIVQDKIEGRDISIGSILDNLSQQIHVTMMHLYEDREPEPAMVIFTEHTYEIVANVASMCKQFESTEIGSGKYMRYCVGIKDVDYPKYDSMFYVLLRGDTFDTIITVAIERLMYPYALGQEASQTYHDYISEHAMQAAQKFLRDDNMEKLRFLVGMDVLTKQETDELIDRAVAAQKADYTALLMDYRHRSFSMADASFDL